MNEKKFWTIETAEEERVVNELLERRYPGLRSDLSHALDAADPQDVVYPGNPGEYSDVVKEIIVLIDSFSGRIDQLSRDVLYGITRRAIGRCFDDAPDEERVHAAVDMIMRYRDSLG